MQSTPLATAGAVTFHLGFPAANVTSPSQRPLKEFGYGDVTLSSDLHEKQLQDTHTVLMELSEDSLFKAFRHMAGQPAPGVDLGGWYHYNPDYDPNTVDVVGLIVLPPVWLLRMNHHWLVTMLLTTGPQALKVGDVQTGLETIAVLLQLSLTRGSASPVYPAHAVS
jgi:hypothetical protein